MRARWAIFRDQLHFHHLAEDQTMWPPARAKLAEDPDGLAVLDAMEDEHRLIDPLLAAVDEALDLGASRARLTTLLSRLHTALDSHLAHEETGTLPLISQIMTGAELTGIFKALGRAGGMRQGSVMFPWALSEAVPETRARVLSQLPPPARLLYRAIWLPRYCRRTPPDSASI